MLMCMEPQCVENVTCLQQFQGGGLSTKKELLWFQKVCAPRCLDLVSGLPVCAEHMFRNGPSVMGCLEPKYLNTLRVGRPQLEPIKRCQLRYRQNSTFSNWFHWLRRAPCGLTSGTRLLVPGTWTPSAHLPLPGKRHGLFSATCSEEAVGKVTIILPGSLAVYMYAL